MSVSDLAAAIDRVLAALPPPTLREADGCLEEAANILGVFATGSTAPELVEAVEGFLRARKELDEVQPLCAAISGILGQYLTGVGAEATVTPPPAPVRPPSPAPRPQPTSKPDPALIAEVQRQGHKISPERVVRIARLPDDRIVWLEEGNEDSGLAHIEATHAPHFERYGIAKSDIVNVVFDALTRGTYRGVSGSNRKVYEISHRGKVRRIAITIGNNGYIVGANPVNMKREPKQKP
ncbi:hypothetical protein SAXI111661_16630 [Saccharomonospora xinjiangensis]|uniref:hypothetical protein n=1 Tax=Saccharomonospora xinjiangensis TaxID=75294 RepID=UPI00106F1FAE|nr:hypothetical protein [Saccharomonospora xinjiangensis]QBQ62461.1 hypothetical protein EYD13_20660 [Saccharomonospora xinjiangensis]